MNPEKRVMAIVCRLFSIFISKAFVKSFFLITNTLEMKILLCIEPLKKEVFWMISVVV